MLERISGREDRGQISEDDSKAAAQERNYKKLNPLATKHSALPNPHRGLGNEAEKLSGCRHESLLTPHVRIKIEIVREIRNLCDVLLDTHVPEDQCTNFLLWLLRRLPTECLNEFCVKAGLVLGQVTTDYPFRAQVTLKDHSRPDALLEFGTDRFLVIETKRPKNPLNASQFTNHITGGIKEFGAEKCWFLFISGDSREPAELEQLRRQYGRQVGFLSWKGVLELLADLKQHIAKPYAILIEEFSRLPNALGLERL